MALKNHQLNVDVQSAPTSSEPENNSMLELEINIAVLWRKLSLSKQELKESIRLCSKFQTDPDFEQRKNKNKN